MTLRRWATVGLKAVATLTLLYFAAAFTSVGGDYITKDYGHGAADKVKGTDIVAFSVGLLGIAVLLWVNRLATRRWLAAIVVHAIAGLSAIAYVAVWASRNHQSDPVGDQVWALLPLQGGIALACGYCFVVEDLLARRAARLVVAAVAGAPVLLIGTIAAVAVASNSGGAVGPSFPDPYKAVPAPAAQFVRPSHIAVASTETVFVVDVDSLIRAVRADGTVGALAGSDLRGNHNGRGKAATFSFITGVAVAADGVVYVSESLDNSIRRITPNGAVSTLIGDSPDAKGGYIDGPLASARLHSPVGLVVDAAGNLYVADADNYAIRKVAPDGTVSTVAGGKLGSMPDWRSGGRAPVDVGVDSAGVLYVVDRDFRLEGRLAVRLLRIAPHGAPAVLVDGGTLGRPDLPPPPYTDPAALAVRPDGTVYMITSDASRVFAIAPDGRVSTLAGAEPAYRDGPAGEARFLRPRAIALGGDGTLYVLDRGDDPQTNRTSPRIRAIAPDGNVRTLAGPGAISPQATR